MRDIFEYNDVRIEYLGHSGFIFTQEQNRIVIDPFLTDAPLATKSPQDIKADAIFITHGHADHIGDAVEIAKQNNATIYSNFEVANYCSGLGAQAIGRPVGNTQKLDWGCYHTRFALHSGLLPNGESFGMAMSILLNFGSTSIYCVGDSALHLDFKLVGEIYQPDIALVPIGGMANMDMEKALIATKWLNPKKVIPIHWDMYADPSTDPMKFKLMVEQNLDIECVVLQP